MKRKEKNVIDYDILASHNRIICGRFPGLERILDSFVNNLQVKIKKLLSTDINISMITIDIKKTYPFKEDLKQTNVSITGFSDGDDTIFLVKNANFVLSLINVLVGNKVHYNRPMSLTPITKFIDDWFNVHIFAPALYDSFNEIKPFNYNYEYYSTDPDDLNSTKDIIVLTLEIEIPEFLKLYVPKRTNEKYVLENDWDIKTRFNRVQIVFPNSFVMKYKDELSHILYDKIIPTQFPQNFMNVSQEIKIPLEVISSIETNTNDLKNILRVGIELLLDKNLGGYVNDMKVFDMFHINTENNISKIGVSDICIKDSVKFESQEKKKTLSQLIPLKFKLVNFKNEFLPIRNYILNMLPYNYTLWMLDKFELRESFMDSNCIIPKFNVLNLLVSYFTKEIEKWTDIHQEDEKLLEKYKENI